MAVPSKPNIRRLFMAADAYREHLLGKSILLIGVDKHGDIQVIELTFRKHHFRHLVGVKTSDTEVSANDFFDRCIDRRLSSDDLLPDYKGFARLELEVSRTLFAADLSATSFGMANMSRLLVNADSVAGNKSGIIGFMRDSSGRNLPITMLNTNVKLETTHEYRVVAAFSKPISDEFYGKPTKVASRLPRNTTWSDILKALPQELNSLDLPDDNSTS